MSGDIAKNDRGILCPKCGCCHFYVSHTERVNERITAGGGIRRRRVCRHCGQRIVTYEGIITKRQAKPSGKA